MTKTPLWDIVTMFFQLHQVFVADGHAQEGGGFIPFKRLLEWMTSSSKAQECDALRHWFEVNELTPFQQEGFEKMNSKYYDQCYRVMGSLRFHAPRDVRPWEYAEMLPVQYLKTAVFTSSFMMTRVKSGGRNKSGFVTVPATAFERLFYLIAMKHLIDMKERGVESSESTTSSDRRKKRRTLRRSVTHPHCFKVERDHIQRVGYAVQTIIRSWDIYSKTLGFSNCEALLAPYLIFDKLNMSFKVLSTREDEFAPVKQMSTITCELYATSSADECDIAALNRNSIQDAALRRLTALFLDDFLSIITSEQLYIRPGRHDSQLLKQLERTENHTPPRFSDIDTDISEPLKSMSEGISMDTEIEAAFPTIRTPTSKATAVLSRNESHVRPHSRPGLKTKIKTVQCSQGENCECFQSRQRLEQEMEKYVRMYCCSFEELASVDASSCATGGLEETGQLLLTDPPFNYRRENGNENSAHDEISREDMETFASLVHDFIGQGGHAVVFCSPLQFKDWYDFFASSEFDPPFLVDTSPLTFVSRPGHYFGNVIRKKTSLHPVTTWALHCTKSGLSLVEAFDLVDYSNHGFVPSRHAAWTNTIDEVGRLLPGEHLRGETPERKMRLFRPEQKSVASMQEVICRFTKPGAQVLDGFAGTFSTAAACISLPKHRTFVGCELQPDVFNAARKRLVEVFANSILNDLCDITTDSEQLLEDAKLVLEHAIYMKKIDKSFQPPEGFPGFQTLPPFLVSIVAAFWNKPDLHQFYGTWPVSSWPQALKGAFQCSSMEYLRASESAYLGLYVAPSGIRHPNAGYGAFAARSFRNNETVGHYYGVLVYSDLSKLQQRTKCYGEEGLLGATVDEFKTYAMQIPIARNGITVGEETVHDVFVVPKGFCVCSKINEPKYYEDDEDLLRVNLREIEPRKANVHFVASKVSKCSQLRSYTCIEVRALRSIVAGEEIFAEYNTFSHHA